MMKKILPYALCVLIGLIVGGSIIVIKDSSRPPQALGATSVLTDNGNRTINGNLVVTGTTTLSNGLALASSTLTGVTINGNVTSTSLVTEINTAFTAATTTQVLCSVTNTTGLDRVLDSVNVVYATSSVTGSDLGRVTISQSATAATGTTLYFDNSLVNGTGVNAVTATSTLTGTVTPSADASKPLWFSGNKINVLQASPTSTYTGSCRIISY